MTTVCIDIDCGRSPILKNRPAERVIKTFPGKCLLEGHNWTFPKPFSDRAEGFSLQDSPGTIHNR